MPRLNRLAAVVKSVWRALDVEVRGSRLYLTIAILAAMCAAYVVMCLAADVTPPWPKRFGDFHALWASAVVAHDGVAAVNYDLDALHARQVALGMPASGEFNPFPYPPVFLLLLAPLGGFARPVAFAIFIGLSFAGYLLAIAGGRWRDWPTLVAAAIAPATGVVLLAGQSGFLSAGLMIGGLRLAERRPLLAGVLFGCLAYKPQLAVLVPVALIAAGLWRAIAAAAATVAVLAAATTAVFHASVWGAWSASLAPYAHMKLAEYLMPTIAASLHLAGAPAPIPLVAQAVAAVAVVIVVWRACRGGLSARAAALVVVGTFLATPHALNYDLPMTTAAIVWYLSERVRSTDGLFVSEIVVLALALAMPGLEVVYGPRGLPIPWAPVLALFLMIALDPYAARAAEGTEAPADAGSPSLRRRVRIVNRAA